MAYGKGRATSYSDFYKGKDRTPENRLDDDEEETKKSGRFSTQPPRRGRVPVKGMPERRKAALQKRLANIRKGK